MNLRLNKFFLLFILCLSFQVTAYGQLPKAGVWQGNIQYSQQTVPFTFEVSFLNENPIITLVNWKERIVIDNSEISENHITIPMHVFDARIIASFSDDKMEGFWIKNDSIPFKAFYNTPRFKVKSKKTTEIKNRLSMTFDPPGASEYPGIGIFNQNGHNVVGTVMTEVGDYRYFEGIVEKNTLKISSFDGVHAFMLTGRYDEGKWKGEFHFDNNYVEKWTGTYDGNAELQDPFEMVTLDNESQKPYFDILAPGSGRNAVDPSEYEGKVVIIQLFGTWCPNSLDETNFLVPWYRENHKRGVEILAVSYEVKYSREYGLQRINDYKKGMNIPYKILLGGRVNKEQAAMAFPFMNRIQAFPTLVILDKKGFARYVNSYFLGAAPRRGAAQCARGRAPGR